ncbi:MAG: HNH endonuclease [Taibaiella sp.]|nr:HNH endonuclease [Taibaiella sp.]
MRPITKTTWPQIDGKNKNYKPHTIAKNDLEDNLDHYCSYCEVVSSDLEVEHVISRNQDASKAHDWDNFILACGRCNGKDNKSDKPVDENAIHFPHRNNTLLSFTYKEGGFVEVNRVLAGKSFSHATALLNLVGLDKIPGNAKYPKLNPNDTRWKHRRIAWEWAKKYLTEYEAGFKSAKNIVDFAVQKGFFSVWFSVFNAHKAVRALLVKKFVGTALNCFDNNFQLIPRNPSNTEDEI